MELYHYWVIAGIILLIAEIATPGGFILASIGLSSFGGSIMAYWNYSFKMQLLGFSILTMVIFFGIRPFYLKYLIGLEAKVGIGINAYIGKEYKVIEEIDNSENTGRLQIRGESWRARSDSGEKIKIDSIVKVIRIEGSTMIVSLTNVQEV